MKFLLGALFGAAALYVASLLTYLFQHSQTETTNPYVVTYRGKSDDSGSWTGPIQ